MTKSWGRWKHVGEQPDEGGQAHVFKVTDQQKEFEGVYALKRLKNNKRTDRFIQEIDNTKKKESEYVAKVVDYDIENKTKFYVMRYYEEGTLREYIENNSSLSFDEKLDISIEIIKGLIKLHVY